MFVHWFALALIDHTSIKMSTEAWKIFLCKRYERKMVMSTRESNALRKILERLRKIIGVRFGLISSVS